MRMPLALSASYLGAHALRDWLFEGYASLHVILYYTTFIQILFAKRYCPFLFCTVRIHSVLIYTFCRNRRCFAEDIS
jgi:hypothetical protein